MNWKTSSEPTTFSWTIVQSFILNDDNDAYPYQTISRYSQGDIRSTQLLTPW